MIKITCDMCVSLTNLLRIYLVVINFCSKIYNLFESCENGYLIQNNIYLLQAGFNWLIDSH